MKTIILLSMLFLHIADDYYLQGILASMKQKSWWKVNAPEDLYRHDYLMALSEHAFSWSFMIHIPIMLYILSKSDENTALLLIPTIMINTIVHAVTDDYKANRHKINLITDQITHFIQILITFWFYMFLIL